ncbi:archaeal flagellin FlaB [Geoglobus ahangari]|uniref:Flagellin n=1 Tax=Geoglobus ahangari TaxID=113653 RepID=A0A0F7ICW4_9EURY|nr:flagellin [Geoglobus ahangari]AKG90728.1 archaeal flagellin FlaB [Geoglobus ahangari]
MVRKKGFKKDEKGAIGIEILIVFIAIVLVAAVSAAVLIQTVGFLQQKAMATGRQTTQEVASGIKVVKVLGHVDSPRSASGTVDLLAIYVEVNTGGQEIDLNATKITLYDGSKTVTFKQNTAAFTDGTSGISDTFDTTQAAWANLSASTDFGIIVLQDEDGSITSGSYPVINAGDKVILTINVSSAFGGWAPRTSVSGEVRPEFGAPGIIEFTTPAAYTESVVELQ